MFIGHFGLGLAAKHADRKPSLGTYFLAAQFLDILWPFFLMAGIEKVTIEPGNTRSTPLNFISYPYSHSLTGALVWGILFGLVYFLFKKAIRSSFLAGILVVSHWVLDFITHRPDLPLNFFGDRKVGLGLWNSVAATVIIEVILFAAGCYLYLKATSARNKSGNIACWSLIAFMLVIYFMNIFSPPPGSVKALEIVAHAQWILVAWGYWIDHNRIAVSRRSQVSL